MDKEKEEKQKWGEIRLRLNQTYKYDIEWEKAISLLELRITRKYFNPLQHIINRRDNEGEGFTIVTVQCALIEALAAFRKGEIFNHNKNNASPIYEYKASKIMFVSILHTASIFENIFWQIDSSTGGKILDAPFNAESFYSDVRCGLMHEARTKGIWAITSTPSTIDILTEPAFLKAENGKIKIYRSVLHHRLLTYFTSYKDELKQNTQEGELLRKFFARKMDHLFDFAPDLNFDWWVA